MAARTRDPGERPLIGSLAAVTFLQWTGSSAVVPLLPVYLTRHTGAPVVGAVMAAFFAGGLLAQFVAGRLADRIGYRPVLVAGLAGYACAGAGFMLPVTGAAYAVLRALQGAGAGAATVASLALIAHRIAASGRGRAFATVNAAQLTGIAVGPMIGTVVGEAGLDRLFLLSATVTLLACAPVLALPPDGPRTRPVARIPAPRAPWGSAGRGTAGQLLLGVLVAAAVSGWVNGVYESCWSLLLTSRGAATWQVTLSWTLFAIPVALISPLAGRLVDGRDRRALVIASVAASAAFCAGYAAVPSPAWLLAVGSFEALGVAVAMPATQAVLADAVPPGADGRGQGLFATVTTAAMAAACLTGGVLFAVSPGLPFVLGGVGGLAATAGLPLIWRGTHRQAPDFRPAFARHPRVPGPTIPRQGVRRARDTQVGGRRVTDRPVVVDVLAPTSAAPAPDLA